jgi:hypothetical protein
MEQVSQDGRREWTPRDQAVAEVAAACGLSIRCIAAFIGFSPPTVGYHLKPAVAAAKLARDKSRYHSEPDRHRQSRRERYAARRHQSLETNRAWKGQNLGRVKELRQKWRRLNADRDREYGRKRRCIKRAGRKIALQPLTMEQRDDRFTIWKYRCAFCGVSATHPRNARQMRLTVEHVLALANGGLDEAGNVAPACAACNSSKRDRSVEEWYRRQTFFTEARWRKIQRHCPTATGQSTLHLTA